MNIVQLQYKLRDMPPSEVQAAANGQNPQIPEVLATMELNRRERIAKAGAQPPTKSIKEQLEEKLTSQPKEQMGLPAMLQQAQQANGEPQQEEVQQPGQPQQMAQAPQQPNPQQAQPNQQPQQMRSGGIAGLPSNMFKRFDEGGIVAFEEGGDVDESAAETARLKRAEEIAAARELLALSGVDQKAPAPAPAPAPAQAQVPADVQRANAAIMQAPGVEMFNKAMERALGGIEKSTPEEEYTATQALHEKFGIKQPKEGEQARIEAAKAAYAKDVENRNILQAAKTLSAGARPNAHGKYMPGTMGDVSASFGLANLEADRNYREAKDKEIAAIGEEQNAFKMNNLKDAIAASKKKKEAETDMLKSAVTASGQYAAHGMSSLTQQLSNEEQKRYHDMYERIEDKKLKAQIAHYADLAKQNIPEVMRSVEYMEQKFPDMMKNMSPEQKIMFAADAGARLRGSESKEATLRLQRDQDIQKAASIDPGVLTAKNNLRKAKTPEEKQKAREDLQNAMLDVAAGFAPISIGTLGSGLPTLPQANQAPPLNGPVTRYDAQARPVSRPAQAPNP